MSGTKTRLGFSGTIPPPPPEGPGQPGEDPRACRTILGHDLHLSRAGIDCPKPSAPPGPLPAQAPADSRPEAVRPSGSGVVAQVADEVTEQLPARRRPSHTGKTGFPSLARLFGRWTTGGGFKSRSGLDLDEDLEIPRDPWLQRLVILFAAALFSFLIALAAVKLHQCASAERSPRAATVAPGPAVTPPAGAPGAAPGASTTATAGAPGAVRPASPGAAPGASTTATAGAPGAVPPASPGAAPGASTTATASSAGAAPSASPGAAPGASTTAPAGAPGAAPPASPGAATATGAAPPSAQAAPATTRAGALEPAATAGAQPPLVPARASEDRTARAKVSAEKRPRGSTGGTLAPRKPRRAPLAPAAGARPRSDPDSLLPLTL